MRLAIALVPGFSYSSEAHEFPVDVVLSTDAPTVIYSKFDVSGALLTHLENPDIYFGYGKRVLPARDKVTELSPESPLRLRIDVFEHDEELDELRPGEYRCDVKVDVMTKVDDKFCPVELRASVMVTLYGCR